jgi:hypothetical protein
MSSEYYGLGLSPSLVVFDFLYIDQPCHWELFITGTAEGIYGQRLKGVLLACSVRSEITIAPFNAARSEMYVETRASGNILWLSNFSKFQMSLQISGGNFVKMEDTSWTQAYIES